MLEYFEQKPFLKLRNYYGKQFFLESKLANDFYVSDQLIISLWIFFAPDLGLIIEIDGSSHANKGEYDFYRQQKLESLGYGMMSFSEGEVLQNVCLVKERIDYAIFCLKQKSPPSIPPQGGRF